MLLTLPAELIHLVLDLIDTQQSLCALSLTNKLLHDEFIKNRLISFNIKHCRGSGLRWAAIQNDTALAQRFLDDPNVDIHATQLDYEALHQLMKLNPNDFDAQHAFYEAECFGQLDSALWKAMYYDNQEVAVLLLENGADKEFPSPPGGEEDASTPFAFCVYNGYDLILQELIRQNANGRPEPAESLIGLSAERGYLTTTKLLLQDTARRYPEHLQTDQSLALCPAAQKGHVEIVEMVLQGGLATTWPPGAVEFGLYEAIERRWPDTIRVFLRNGANIGHRLDLLDTAVRIARSREKARESTFQILFEVCKGIVDGDKRAEVERILNSDARVEGLCNCPGC
ncbi:uncharacterized protein BDV14DRAFT_194681 [Aspergillus stella-maris]|uniref:uncharacterized protein n=1 Tax=Aspergillus stella-maris TaxID=1810926 RepID=UPI003CCCC15C